MNITQIIDKEIKQMWLNEIAEDYREHRLLKEDSLKNAFYHHLRNRLGDDFLDKNNLRIFTEFSDGMLQGTKKVADIAIVEMANPSKSYSKPLREYVENIVAIIELKYKNGSASTNENINRDVQKLKEYIQIHNIDCQYYLAVIQEAHLGKQNWVNGNAVRGWAKGKVTELTASYDKNYEMQFDIIPYNGLNQGMEKSSSYENE